MRSPTPQEAAALSVPLLLERVREHAHFSLERPATADDLAAGEAAWRSWFGMEMPVAYRNLLATSNGVNYNGLYLFAAVAYWVVVEGGADRWMPGIGSENSGLLWGIAEEEARRFFGSVDDDLFAYDRVTRRWLVVDRVDWSGTPYQEFASLEDLLVDRLFCYLDEAPDA